MSADNPRTVYYQPGRGDGVSDVQINHPSGTITLVNIGNGLQESSLIDKAVLGGLAHKLNLTREEMTTKIKSLKPGESLTIPD